jgi:hypothetical protein
MKLQTPINDWARCLYILIENRKTYVDMQKVLLQYPFFYKFQARLSDLKVLLRQKGFDFKVSTESVPFANKKLNKTGYYFKYKALSNESELKKMFLSINVKGASKK